MKSSELPLVAVVGIPCLPTPPPPHPASFIPESSLLPLSLLERCSSVSFALSSLLSFWWLIHSEPAFGGRRLPSGLAPQNRPHRAGHCCPSSGTTRVGERVAHCPGGQMTDSSLGSSAQRAAWNRACARVRHSILLSLLPFRRKGALLPPISLQAHAFNSTKMFSTWRR